MRSVRLGEELERRLERAADATGQSASEIVRRAVREECDEILGSTLSEALGDFVGCATDVKRSRRKHSEFGDYLMAKHAPERRRKFGDAGRSGKEESGVIKRRATERSRSKRGGVKRKSAGRKDPS